MDSRAFFISRRVLLGGAAAAAVLPRQVRAAERTTASLELSPSTLNLGHNQPISEATFKPVAPLRFVRGDVAEVTVRNALEVAATIGWRGLDGAPELQPWLARAPLPAGSAAVFTVPLRHAGTLLCEARTVDGLRLAALPLIVAENPVFAADADETLLIEARGSEPGTLIYEVNQQRVPLELKTSSDARLRFRLINAAQYAVFALQFSGLTPTVVALDGQPCEPFAARDARVVLFPGTRVDVIVEAAGAAGVFQMTLQDGKQTVPIATFTVSGNPTRSGPFPTSSALPSNGLPERLAMASALRVDLKVDEAADWAAPAKISASTAPAFIVKRGRSVVLALRNASERGMVFHLNGHHFRSLDRLDDGWKPFWLDTAAVPPRQTLRIAFLAEHAGAYLLETCALEPGATPRMRNYHVIA